MKPIIAIAWNSKLPDYEEAVRQAGGEPWVVKPGDRVDEVVERADGILLTGGGDVDPSQYGGARHPTTQNAEGGRDELEIAIARRALDNDLPLLAICRGVQVLNVAAGGTLVQDLPSERQTKLPHEVRHPPDAIAHEIIVAPGTKLAELLKENGEVPPSCSVNSRHHQAVDRVAEGFRQAAVAPDGTVEAIERPGARFCIGVQWHPENFWRSGKFRTLFEGLVKAAKGG
jgi:putative glutamine amidotransferase